MPGFVACSHRILKARSSAQALWIAQNSISRFAEYAFYNQFVKADEATSAVKDRLQKRDEARLQSILARCKYFPKSGGF